MQSTSPIYSLPVLLYHRIVNKQSIIGKHKVYVWEKDFEKQMQYLKDNGYQTITFYDLQRIYGLRTVAFRQSCIYGTRQFGIEDQGWVAWFTIAAVLGKKITIYGDGKQIRDVLHVDDLVRAYEAAATHQDQAIGQAFNVGGGPGNTMSLLELLAYLREELKIDIPLQWDKWRPGDQPVFVCDIRKAQEHLGWQPEISVRQGVKNLSAWVNQNAGLFSWLK